MHMREGGSLGVKIIFFGKTLLINKFLKSKKIWKIIWILLQVFHPPSCTSNIFVSMCGSGGGVIRDLRSTSTAYFAIVLDNLKNLFLFCFDLFPDMQIIIWYCQFNMSIWNIFMCFREIFSSFCTHRKVSISMMNLIWVLLARRCGKFYEGFFHKISVNNLKKILHVHPQTPLKISFKK